jgi:hypothetical protein
VKTYFELPGYDTVWTGRFKRTDLIYHENGGNMFIRNAGRNPHHENIFYYIILVGKPEGKRPLVRPRRRWEDNIRMDLGER